VGPLADNVHCRAVLQCDSAHADHPGLSSVDRHGALCTTRTEATSLACALQKAPHTGAGACRYKEVSSTPTYGGALSLGKRMHIRVKARTRPQPCRPSHLHAHFRGMHGFAGGTTPHTLVPGEMTKALQGPAELPSACQIEISSPSPCLA